MKKKLVLVIYCCFVFQMQSLAAPNVPGIIPQAGTINTHDMETLKKQRFEQQIQEDYQNFEEQKKLDKKKDKKKYQKDKSNVIKAKPEEYATKGVYVENIEVSPSQILSEDEIKSIIDNYTQTNITPEELKEIKNRLNQLYLEKGFVTARAYVPPQAVENGIIKIELLEGKVGNVNITGNRWTRKSYIEKRINLKQGDLFNIGVLEEDILIFNRYNDNVDLRGTLEPGKDTLGTTDINIKTYEKLPFHITALMDNAGRKTIGEYRAGLMLQDDSLLGFRDKLTIGAYANKYSVTPFADYNIPVNKKDGRIGFNFSSSNSEIGHGPYKDFKIKSNSQNYSLYYSQPLYRRSWTELTSITSMSYKRAETKIDGYRLYTDEVTTAQTGLNYRYDTKRGIWYLNQNVGYSFPIFDKHSNYLKLDGNIFRLHYFGHGFIGSLRANYQVIPNRGRVPYVDQFLAGGVATVRGYSEGLLIGRDGYLVSAELLFPLGPQTINVGSEKNKEIPFTGKFLKGFVFVDHAGVFPQKRTIPEEKYTKNDFLISIGGGIKINLPKDLSLRLSWGFPLMRNSHNTESRWGRFHFELCIQPDFDALLKLRHPKAKQKDETKNAPTETL